MNIRNSIIGPIEHVRDALTELKRAGIVVAHSVAVHLSLPPMLQDGECAVDFTVEVVIPD